ncbi:MAG: NADH-quinone oxidoreductase subunit NuoK [Candidatus Bathyarchaeia archaeon]
MIPYQPFIVSTVLLMAIGLGCMMMRRDMIRLLMGIEILFNAANLNFIALSAQVEGYVDPLAQSVVMMAIVLDGAVIAVGLAMTLNVYRHYRTVDVRRLRRLRW